MIVPKLKRHSVKSKWEMFPESIFTTTEKKINQSPKPYGNFDLKLKTYSISLHLFNRDPIILQTN